MDDEKCWVILSLKWSQAAPKPENLVWYKPNSCGYTEDLDSAGLYTEAEAMRRSDGEVTLAVPFALAALQARYVALVEASAATVETFRKLAPLALRKRPVEPAAASRGEG